MFYSLSEQQPTLKIMIIGPHKVGKTTIIQRYIGHPFLPRYRVTIGVEFKTKIINVDGKPIKLVLGDCGGQEKFIRLRKTYYTGASGGTLVYDITNRSSFEVLDQWVEEFRSVTDDSVPMVLIGNKIDLYDIREVKYEEGLKKAEVIGATFFETSAKRETEIIEAAFENLVRRKLQTQMT
ncbi:MAG: Rab family GTPase [Candidatus Hodarchaeota archaeon]